MSKESGIDRIKEIWKKEWTGMDSFAIGDEVVDFLNKRKNKRILSSEIGEAIESVLEDIIEENIREVAKEIFKRIDEKCVKNSDISFALRREEVVDLKKEFGVEDEHRK